MSQPSIREIQNISFIFFAIFLQGKFLSHETGECHQCIQQLNFSNIACTRSRWSCINQIFVEYKNVHLYRTKVYFQKILFFIIVCFLVLFFYVAVRLAVCIPVLYLEPLST